MYNFIHESKYNYYIIIYIYIYILSYDKSGEIFFYE